jgi:hypothetical protein
VPLMILDAEAIFFKLIEEFAVNALAGVPLEIDCLDCFSLTDDCFLYAPSVLMCSMADLFFFYCLIPVASCLYSWEVISLSIALKSSSDRFPLFLMNLSRH